jgi:hypothetical protein
VKKTIQLGLERHDAAGHSENHHECSRDERDEQMNVEDQSAHVGFGDRLTRLKEANPIGQAASMTIVHQSQCRDNWRNIAISLFNREEKYFSFGSLLIRPGCNR